MTIENGHQEDERFYWIYEGRSNRPLQLFFYATDWTDYTDQQKSDWLTFATRGHIVLSTILPLGDDMIEWTVVKKYVPESNLEAGAARQIHIPGSTNWFSTANRLP